MEEKIFFQIGKDTLRGSLFIPKGTGPFPGVIFFHGSESKGEMYVEAAKLLSEKGIVGFAFNYRGCGLSDGKISDQTIGSGMQDVTHALNLFFARKELDTTRVGLFGGSYGGFLASIASQRHPFKSILLSAPAAYAPSDMDLVHGTPIIDRKDFLKSYSYDAIKQFRGSLLIIQCELDDVLPKGMVEEYILKTQDNPKQEVYILKNTKHRISQQKESKEILLQKIISWFTKTL